MCQQYLFVSAVGTIGSLYSACHNYEGRGYKDNVDHKDDGS
jgi:hypothetical protein